MFALASSSAVPATTIPAPFFWGAVALGALFVVWILLSFLKAFLIVCRPSEMLIVSGKRQKLADGRTLGFQVHQGGRVLRVPILQKVDFMDTTLMPIAIETSNAYSKGGIALSVQAIAMVKISSDRRVLSNAVERFLGKPRGYVQQVSRETLEGHLRGVLATLTPEEINEDRLKFAEKLREEAEADFAKLGLHLDTLKLQHIADDSQYLNSLGRERIANILRDAEVAESNSKAAADQAQAEAEAAGRVAQEKAQQAIVRKQNELRTIKADLDSTAQSEMERAEAGAEEAFAIAEQQLQGVRANLEKIRLEADVEIPADARRIAAEQLAAGRSAKISEEGRARAEVLGWMKGVWEKAGPNASEIFLLRQLDDVLGPIVDAVRQVKVSDTSVVDSGDGKNFAALLASRPAAVLEILGRLGSITGLDLDLATTNAAAPGAPPSLPDGGGRARLGTGAAKPEGVR